MRKILVIADVPNWAWDRFYIGLNKYCKDFQFVVRYGQQLKFKNLFKDHEQFDLILYLLDYRPDTLICAKIPKEKVVVSIMSMVKHPFYNDFKKMSDIASIYLVANKLLFERFKKLNSVKLASDGVDTNFFTRKQCQYLHNPIVVGWAGSRDNFGHKLRGLSLIKEACESVNYIFNPALREEKWRTMNEMVDYYQNEIDIYVDASCEAGKQNGLLEAGACGKALIATKNVGISSELINNEKNGFLVDRTVKDITRALKDITPFINLFGAEIRKTIESEWSWEKKGTFFSNLFNEIL